MMSSQFIDNLLLKYKTSSRCQFIEKRPNSRTHAKVQKPGSKLNIVQIWHSATILVC